MVDASLITCPVCLDQYKDPRILPCHHSFCKECLDSVPLEQETLRCPVCRESTSVHGIQRSFVINELLESQHRRSNQPENLNSSTVNNSIYPDSVCEEHKKDEDIFCEKCIAVICHHCAIRRHQQHPTMLISDCYNKEILPIQEKISQLSTTIADVERAHESLEKTGQEILDQEKSIQDIVNATADTIICSINQSREALLKEARESAERKLAVIQMQKDTATATVEQLKEHECSVNSLLKEGSPKCILEGKPEVMKELASSIKNVKLECLEPAEILDIEFCVNERLMVDVIGSIDVSYINEAFEGEDEIIPSPIVDKQTVFKLTYNVKEGSGFKPPAEMISGFITKADATDDESCKLQVHVEYNGENKYGLSFIPTSSGPYQLAVEVAGHPIQKSPFTFHVLPSFVKDSVYQLKTPHGIAVARNGTLAVSTNDNCTVHTYQHNGAETKWTASCRNPTGLAITDEGYILATDERTLHVKKFGLCGEFLAQTERTVMLFSMDTEMRINPCAITIHHGQVYVIAYETGIMSIINVHVLQLDQENLTYHPCHFEPVFSRQTRPTGIALDSQDNIYVTDKELGVCKYNSSTKTITSFGSKGTEEGQLKFPMGLAIDKHDIIYVADTGNNRISVFSSNGRFLMLFGSKLCRPHGIAIGDETGRAFVTDNGNNRVVVYTSK